MRLLLVSLVGIGAGGCAVPRYGLDMAFAPDRPDAPPLKTAQDECRYTVEKRAGHFGATGTSAIEVRLIGDLAEACMRAKGYRTIRKRVVRESG